VGCRDPHQPRFLNNDLVEGRYQVNGRPVALSELHMPMFVVGTLRDNVAPWKSTYKINFLADADITYVLTSGGHNAGIVAPPAEEGHSYQVLAKKAHDPYLGPDEWIKRAPSHEGSWWTEWTRFLTAHSGQSVPASAPAGAQQKGTPLDDAPGSYVLEP
jgi:polyhydroxyalkanoate synthase